MNGLRRQLERAMQAALTDAGHTLSPNTVALLAKAAAERVVWPAITKLTTERDKARAEVQQWRDCREQDASGKLACQLPAHHGGPHMHSGSGGTTAWGTDLHDEAGSPHEH